MFFFISVFLSILSQYLFFLVCAPSIVLVFWPRWFDIDCAINLICVTNVSFTQNLQLQRKKTFKETFCFILLLHSFSFYCQIPSFLEKLRTQLFNLQLEPCQGQYKFNFTVFKTSDFAKWLFYENSLSTWVLLIKWNGAFLIKNFWSFDVVNDVLSNCLIRWKYSS